MTRRNITIKDIRFTYPKEKWATEKYGLWSHVLRPVSYYAAWLFIRLGISANIVTGSSIILGLIGCVLLAFGSYAGMIIGALILNIWALLEYVDGNIARGTNTSSNYGELIDNLNCYITAVLFFISVGMGAFNHPDHNLSHLINHFLSVNLDRSIFLVLGGLSASFFYLPHVVGAAFKRILLQQQSIDNAAKTVEDITGNSVYEIVFKNTMNITGIIMPILLIAVIFRFLSLFVFFYALITISVFVSITILILKNCKKI